MLNKKTEKHNISTCFGHADTAVNDRVSLVDFVRDDPNEELWLSIEFALVCEALKSYLIQSLYTQIQTNQP